MTPEAVLQQAESCLKESEESYSSENFYASFFHAKECLEHSLLCLYLKKFKKDPKTKDAVYLMKDVDLPQNIKELCNKVLEPIHPSRLHSPRTTGELLDAAKQIFSFVKNAQ